MRRKPFLSADFVVILCGVSAALHIGKLPPAIPVLQEALGMTLVEAGFLLSLVQFAGILFGLALGIAADSIGLRRSMLAGLLILVVSSLLGGWATTVAELLWLRGAEGLGTLLTVLPAPSLIRQLVSSDRLSLSLGVWGAYMPVGTALALLVGPWVMLGFDWPGWWWLLALVSALMALWLVWAVPSDAQRRQAAAQARPGVAISWWSRLRDTLGSSGPWLVALTFSMYSAQWLAVIGFLPTVYDQAGIAAITAGALTALVAVSNAGGNILSGRLVHRGVRPHTLLYFSFACMGVGGLAAFALPESYFWLRYLSVVIFSSISGMIPATLFMVGVRLAPGEHTISSVMGWIQEFIAIGQFVGAPIVAWVAGLAGGWQWTGVVTGSACLIGIALVTRMPERYSPPSG